MSDQNSNSSESGSQRHRSHIEQVVSIKPSTKYDCFTNGSNLNYPPWARGVYGGQIMAQALLAGYETVKTEFMVHSIHSHFLKAAQPEISVVYRVERVRDTRSFATRMIRAMQADILVFYSTASFVKNNTPQESKRTLRHSTHYPQGEKPPSRSLVQSAAGQTGPDQPCDCVRVASRMNNSASPNDKRFYHWVRARERIAKSPLKAAANQDGRSCNSRSLGNISEDTADVENDHHHRNHHAHAAALLYMSDNYFLATCFRAHNASRFSNPTSDHSSSYTIGHQANESHGAERLFHSLASEELEDNQGAPKDGGHVTMAASMDHTVYFHNVHQLQADDWMLVEMESPWADDERGLVVSRIWSHDDTLAATCVQEGLVRLAQSHHLSRL
ncbi:acyl-coenzyme A thioesterase 8 [Fusarium pseudocircinatum]|uniref:Acyl-coenzyme A thioesterase 8 n=1 Tax=Fusarium pseudocircinatum TaxID=56676 RepID=A0A8H5PRV4_9HYPO|nr:acyl-coenzyme A thioesterase 8 [Fusarium pseudocircinatum]